MERSSRDGMGMGLLAGAVIGFVAGILFAPRRGYETRQMLREKYDDLSSTVRTRADQWRSRGNRVDGTEEEIESKV